MFEYTITIVDKSTAAIKRMHANMPCRERLNGVCGFSDCPCAEMKSKPKFRTFSEEVIKGRFQGEIKL